MGNVNRSVSAATRCHNRVGALMVHCARYSFRGTSRLAADAGLAKSTVSQLVRGKSHPLYSTLLAVVKCLESQLGRTLDLREVFSTDGQYPTPFVCELTGCRGCLPDSAYSKDGTRKERSLAIEPGTWTGDVDEFLEGETA
jgi:transcriptional regulator with XRE-family HTH domain